MSVKDMIVSNLPEYVIGAAAAAVSITAISKLLKENSKRVAYVKGFICGREYSDEEACK